MFLLHSYVQDIQRVEVQKRVKNSVVIMRFANVELRIGVHDQSEDGSRPFDKNPLVGHYAEGTLDPMVVFQMPPGGVTGRFLTLQMIGSGILDVGELYVF